MYSLLFLAFAAAPSYDLATAKQDYMLLESRVTELEVRVARVEYRLDQLESPAVPDVVEADGTKAHFTAAGSCADGSCSVAGKAATVVKAPVNVVRRVAQRRPVRSAFGRLLSFRPFRGCR